MLGITTRPKCSVFTLDFSSQQGRDMLFPSGDDAGSLFSSFRRLLALERHGIVLIIPAGLLSTLAQISTDEEKTGWMDGWELRLH
jgi:hypothetical protein